MVKNDNKYYFARDIALLLQAHEASAHTSLSLEQLFQRLDPLLSPEESEVVKKFFTALLGINSTELIPKVALDFKNNIKRAITSSTSAKLLSDKQIIEFESGLEKIFSQLASFLLRATKRGINDLRELSLHARLAGQKLALDNQSAGDLAYAFDTIIDNVAEEILLIIAVDTMRAYKVSGTDLSMVSGSAWAANGSRAEYLGLLLEPIEVLSKYYSEWFSKLTFVEKLVAIREKVKSQQPEKLIENKQAEPIVCSIVLGLLFDALIKHDLDTARILAGFILEQAESTIQPVLAGLLPDIMRSPVQLIAHAPKVNLEVEPSTQDEQLIFGATEHKRISADHLLQASRDAFQNFVKRADINFNLQKTNHNQFIISEQYLERDISRYLQEENKAHRALTSLLSTCIQHDCQQAIEHPRTTMHVDNVTGAVVGVKHKNKYTLPALDTLQLTQIKYSMQKSTTSIESLSVCCIELLGLHLREAPMLNYAYYQLADIALDVLSQKDFANRELLTGLQVVAQSEFRFKLLSSSPTAVFNALRVVERFKSENGFVRIKQTIQDVQGSLAILLEGVLGQLFSQEARYRIFLARQGRSDIQLHHCWHESEQRMRQELELHALQKITKHVVSSQFEKAMQQVRDLDVRSRRLSCLGLCLDILLVTKELSQTALSNQIGDFIKNNLIGECIFFEIDPKEPQQLDAKQIDNTIQSIEAFANSVAQDLLLSGAGPEVSLRFRKDSQAAEKLLSEHFASAARVSRRSVLPARTPPFKKFEIAVRYAEVYELFKETARRI